jgi:phospholipid/cholesterol/gamma-HCH transport system substrate-binding protein
MMRAEKNKWTVKVGIFIAVGTLILIVAVFTLGGQKRSFAPSITLHAVFDDVNGLQKGDNVFYSGVKVGTVKDIEFSGVAQVRVTMNVEKRVQKYVGQDVKARIGSEGLIGSKIVVLYDGNPQTGLIQEGMQLSVDETVSTSDIMASLQENNRNLVSITNDLKTVARRLAEGQGTLGALLTNDTLFRSLKATMDNLQVAANNSATLTKSIADYTAKLQQPGTLADGLVNDTMIMANLQSASRQINNAAEDTRAFTQSIQDAGEKLQSGNNAAGFLLNDTLVARQLREIFTNLESSSVKLDENLEAMQHNFLLRGFFRKRERQQAWDQRQQEKKAKKEQERKEKEAKEAREARQKLYSVNPPEN